ncbi:MAG: hypothetical protein U1E39_06820 [Planctomycetota bacterium]
MDVLTRHRLQRLDLDPEALARLTVAERVGRVYRRFLRAVPYENYSALARRRERPAQPATWPRGTDRLLDDVAHEGLGGTCFAMAYALADLFRGVGANAHTALGHHLAKEEPHAVVLVYGEEGPRLYDASYFVGDAIPVWPGASLDDGIFRYTLEPRRGPLLAMVRTSRAGVVTPLYALVPMPAPPDAYLRLWVEAVRALAGRPGRLARRVGDEIRWFGEEAGRVDVITATGCRAVPVGPDPIATLHRLFGVREDTLRAHLSAVVPG